ncbi:MAG: uracil-DNA glycosylase [Thiotrichales bacterium]
MRAIKTGEIVRIGATLYIRGMSAAYDARSAYLDALGITEWVLRRGGAPAESAAEVPAVALDTAPCAAAVVVESPRPELIATADAGPTAAASQASNMPTAELDWSGLEAAVKACHQCELSQSRTQTVFGVGNRAARCLVIGEAPGEQEDLQGEPFVGRAGLLLNNMLLAIGYPREAVYIANILKCRPPGNRDPRPEEAIACQDFLFRQIALIRPGLLLSVGRIAAQHLLQTDTPIGRLRGKVHRLPGFDLPLVVTYHPAYLLRRPDEKRKAWDDLKLALEVLRHGGGA